MAWVENEPPYADVTVFDEYMKTYEEDYCKDDQDTLYRLYWEDSSHTIVRECFDGVPNVSDDLSMALGACGGFAVGKYGIA